MSRLREQEDAPVVSVGLDVSKDTLNACLLIDNKRHEKQFANDTAGHRQSQRDSRLLQSVPGVGEITAWDILAEMPDVEEFDSAQSVAAYAGLAPREVRSGSSVRKQTTLSRRGNSCLRKAFYFPAVTAITWNPLIKAHYERLRGKGKPKMVALAACMRKMMMICYGVLKHQKPFDAQWENQSAGHPSSKPIEPAALAS